MLRPRECQLWDYSFTHRFSVHIKVKQSGLCTCRAGAFGFHGSVRALPLVVLAAKLALGSLMQRARGQGAVCSEVAILPAVTFLPLSFTVFWSLARACLSAQGLEHRRVSSSSFLWLRGRQESAVSSRQEPAGLWEPDRIL